jgi:small-conductance mechanosensitive channel/CRP-like cAMP-binding protein
MPDPASISSWWGSAFLHIVLVGVAGIVVWHLIPSRRANMRLIVQIVFFLAMSGLLFSGQIIPYDPPTATKTPGTVILVGAAKLLWWVHLAWALIGFVRIYLVIEAKPREARLLQDLVVGIVYIGMFLSVLAFVFGVPVGTLIATSGVFAIVLGLALQNTLSDVFSGIALNLGRPYVPGNWIVLSDGTEGRVIETNWRATHLLTSARNVVVLPNRFLSQLGLTNVSRPNESHRLAVKVRILPTTTPAAVVDVMQVVLMSSNTILKDPPSYVAVKNQDAAAIEVDLFFGVADVEHRVTARNEIFDLVYRHSRSAGLLLAQPSSASIAMTRSPRRIEDDQRHMPMELIKAIPVFSALTDDDREMLAAKISVHAYRKDEIIVRQGETLPSLMILRKGVIVREREKEDGHKKEISCLSPADFFGETGLLAGIGEMATLRALTDVIVYEVDQESFAPLLLERPELAQDLAAILSLRMVAIDEASESRYQNAAHSKFALLRSIRKAFRLSRPNANRHL